MRFTDERTFMPRARGGTIGCGIMARWIICACIGRIILKDGTRAEATACRMIGTLARSNMTSLQKARMLSNRAAGRRAARDVCQALGKKVGLMHGPSLAVRRCRHCLWRNAGY